MDASTITALLAFAGTAFAAPQFGSLPSFPGLNSGSGLSFPGRGSGSGSGFSIPSGFSLPSGFTFPGFPSKPSPTISPSLPASSSPASAPATPTTPTTGNPAPAGNCASSSGGSTENGISGSQCCAPLTVIFARGTSEGGNVGSVAGPPMFKSLRSQLGANNVLVQGVDYPADAAGNANMGASGGPAMASNIKTILQRCPNTKIIASGYSQGGMVVHNAFSSQGITSKQVKGSVIFGDPFNGQKVGDLPTSSVKEFCASGDSVCNGGGFGITPAHMTYGNNAEEAANFIIQLTGVGK